MHRHCLRVVYFMLLYPCGFFLANDENDIKMPGFSFRNLAWRFLRVSFKDLLPASRFVGSSQLFSGLSRNSFIFMHMSVYAFFLSCRPSVLPTKLFLLIFNFWARTVVHPVFLPEDVGGLCKTALRTSFGASRTCFDRTFNATSDLHTSGYLVGDSSLFLIKCCASLIGVAAASESWTESSPAVLEALLLLLSELLLWVSFGTFEADINFLLAVSSCLFSDLILLYSGRAMKALKEMKTRSIINSFIYVK